MSDGITTNPGPARQATGFVHLGRGSKWMTRLQWKPSDPARKQPELTPDYSAVVASLDTTELPAEIKQGQKFVLPLDCSVAPIGHWALVTPTSSLCDFFLVNGASHFPPGSSGVPEVTVTAKRACKKDEIPLSAFYLMLLS